MKKILVILLSLFMLCGCHKEYETLKIEGIKEITYEELTQSLNSPVKFILYIGRPDCGDCMAFYPLLEDYINEHEGMGIYYLNIKEDRANNTEEYKKLVELLKDYLYDDDNGNKRIYVPDVYFIKDGNIVGHNNDTSTIQGADTADYYTDEARQQLKDKLTELVNKVYGKDSCNDSSKGC